MKTTAWLRVRTATVPTMNDDRLKRFSVVAGGGVFVLSLVGQLAYVELGFALLVSVGVGVGLGLGCYVVGSILLLANASAPPESPAEGVEGQASTQEGQPGEPGLQDTATATPAGEAAPQADLYQTVRLDEGNVDFVLPEVSPEELIKEREGIDETVLKQGIEESAPTSENSGRS